MRTSFDFAPLVRSGVGFDRVFDHLDNATRLQTIENWPPYDIAKSGDGTYRIEMAVAGFGQDELTITAQANLLIVSGEKTGEAHGEFLHRGIAMRSFTRRFELADHVKVVGASLANGLLAIELRREIPEALKPRRIAIGTGGAEPAQLADHKKAA
jgi:molecular chaperone IbpA